MEYANKKIISISAAVAALVIIIAAFSCKGVLDSYKKEQQKCEVFSTATVSQGYKVKSYPLSVAFTNGKIEQTGDIKILARRGNWCKIIYVAKGKIKEGFIKATELTNIKGGIVEASVITLSRGNFTSPVGEEVEIGAQLYPQYSNEQIEWTSSDDKIASVENGKVTINGVGTATITAKIKSNSKSIAVTGVSADSEFKFDGDEYSLNINNSLDLSKKLGGKESGEITWSSSDENVVSVSGGKIKALKAGAVIIKATKNGAEASCRVYVKNANKNASTWLNITNAYGDVFNYHPSVQYFENGFGGYKYWIAYTPYKGCSDYWENPHIAASNDLKNWVVPSGFSNPLDPRPSNYERGAVYNSDTELVYNTDTGLLECWWRFYDKPNNRTALRRRTTKDGVHWSDAEDMLYGELHVYDFLSPAIVYENGTYKMWAINQNTNHSLDYRESTDGKHWSEIRQIQITYDDKELANWHLDVIHTTKGYEAVISSYYPKVNERTHMDLYYTYSTDNVHYTKAEKLFTPSRGTSNWDNRGLYRCSLLYADGKYYLFYSGLNEKTGPSGLGLISGKDVYTMS